jgi:hypothetical protein
MIIGLTSEHTLITPYLSLNRIHAYTTLWAPSHHQTYNIQHCIPSRANGCEGKMAKKKNVMLYVDNGLIVKSCQARATKG